MGGFSHIARICLLWDVMRAHGHDLGGGTIFLLLSGFFVILVYFFYAYRSSLSAKVAAISAALMSLFLSAALFHASSLNHVAPGAAIGAAVGLWLYALLGQDACEAHQHTWHTSTHRSAFASSSRQPRILCPSPCLSHLVPRHVL
jgi:hypothetical protein